MAFSALYVSLMSSIVYLIFFGFVSVTGQQFADDRINHSYEDMSQGCTTALNTLVSCSPLLPSVADELPRLRLEDLNNICTASCLTSLQSARTIIASSCTVNDIMPVHGVPYPATYMVDYFIYAYTLMCSRDTATQKFCDVLFAEWINEYPRTDADAKACSHCILGNEKIQLNSPFGFNSGLALNHIARTSSCSKTGYSFTTPTPYPVVSTTTSSPPSIPTLDASCITLHTIQAGDTCNSIAIARNVSSYAIYGSTGISDCLNLQAGKKICLLGQCKRYLVKTGDTCDQIIAANAITVDPQVFTAWNPNIDALCRNIESLVGQQICLSRPDGLVLPEFSNDYSTPTATTWPVHSVPVETQLPTAPGTLSGCRGFRNYKVIKPIEDPFYTPQRYFSNKLANDCSYVSNIHGVELADFLMWNPTLALDQTSCKLAAGYSYCIDHPNKGAGETNDCQAVSPSLIPSGTTATCTCYITFGGHESAWLNCETFQVGYDITEAQIMTWNPWVGTPCNVFTNLATTAQRAICIRGSGWTSPSSTLSSISSGTSTTSISQSISSSGSATSTSLSSSSTSVSTTQLSTSVSQSSTTTSISVTGSSTSIIISSTTSSVLLTSSTTISSTGLPSTTTTPITSSSTTSSSPSSSVSPSSVCIAGAGLGNYMGLCDYTCQYGYCPPGPCSCTAYGTPNPAPAPSFPIGYPAPGLDASYTGLCQFCCLRGYCPAGACTYTAP